MGAKHGLKRELGFKTKFCLILGEKKGEEEEGTEKKKKKKEEEEVKFKVWILTLSMESNFEYGSLDFCMEIMNFVWDYV